MSASDPRMHCKAVSVFGLIQELHKESRVKRMGSIQWRSYKSWTPAKIGVTSTKIQVSKCTTQSISVAIHDGGKQVLAGEDIVYLRGQEEF